MAKRLLLNVLVKVLGEFIELNEENLNLGVWSGQIVLNNLKLRSDKFLRNMNVVINHGSVRSLEIKIPWATLLQNPIKIKITGVYLDVGPLDVSSLNLAEEYTRIMEDKLRKLKIADKYLELSSSLNGEVGAGAQANNKDDSYWSQWTSKIIDNIEVVLSEVHLRYEDSMSVPGKIVSFGCTLESFEISTCDENWQPTAFSSSKTTNSAIAVNKLATIKSLGIYWQVSEAQSISSLPVEEWEKRMQQMIYKLNSGNKPTTQLQYILSPFKNSLFLRLTHNKKQLNGAPKFDVLAESSNLQLDLDSVQYQQLFQVLDRFGSIQRSELPNLYCPKVRPTDRASARLWWRYAVKLVLIRPRYIRLVKLSRVSEEDTNLSSLFSETDAREKRMYEERLSFSTLKLFRQIAILEMTDDLRRKHLKAHGGVEGAHSSSGGDASPGAGGTGAAGGESRGWIGWLTGGGGASTPTTGSEWSHSDSQRSAVGGSGTHSPMVGSAHGGGGPGEDISIESIISSLNKQEEIQKTANALYLRFSINSSSSVCLSAGLTPIVLCNSTVAFSFAQATSGISFSCELKDFIVVDKLTVNPPIPNIVSVKRTMAEKPQQQLQRSLSYSDLNSRPTLSVLFESKSGKSRLTISALPIELAINKVCISRLLTEFSRPENRYAAAAKRSVDVKTERESGRKGRRSPNKDKTTSGSGAGAVVGKNKTAAASSAGQSSLSSYLKYVGGSNAASDTSGSSSSSSSAAVADKEEGEGDMEILFEAYAPKIIAPEDSTCDKGYLLLDCGYLVIRGNFRSAGFDLSVSLTDINAGLPQSIRDMYTFGDKSLYLIKPFDIVVGVQNVDKSLANMTVNVEIKPELRGEIDSVKLARLLKALSEVSGTFFGGKPSKPPVDSAITPRSSQLQLAGLSTPVKGRAGDGTAGVNRQAAGSSDSESFMTPQKLPLSLPNSSVKPRPAPNAAAATVPSSAVVDIEPVETSSQTVEEEADDVLEGNQVPVPDRAEGVDVSVDDDVNPLRNDLNIRLWIPVLALDLAYNVELGYHLVFFVRTLQTTIISRPFDKRILFDLSEISIQDSFRSDSQKDIAWTPNEGGNLIHISYTNVNSRRSPLYTNCATEVIANFANLGLNIDVNTVNHLKPFFDVLLAKSPAPPPSEDAAGSTAATTAQGAVSEPTSPLRVLTRTASKLAQRQITVAAAAEALSNAVEPSPSLLSLTGQEPPPSGMKINFSMERFSVDLLRVSTNEVAGQELDTAFSLQISRLRCDLDMFELMKADVTITSVEIFDMRKVSKDYVFRKVFCPAYDAAEKEESGNQSEKTGERGAGGDSAAGEYIIGDQITDLAVEKASPTAVVDPLIRVLYSQESKSHSLIKVVVSNVTSFVSIDTILDLSFVFMGNFFALLGLFSGPKQPEKEAPTPASTPAAPTRTTRDDEVGEEVLDPSEISTSTMNLVVQVVNPRLILLEDPTSLESQAIVGRCGIEVHYTRETKTRTLPNGTTSSELTESLHVTMLKYEVFVLRNMMNWRPQPILEPIDIEFHLKRRSINGVGVFSNFHFEVDHIEAKVTFNDLVLAQSILSRRTLTEPGVEAEQPAPEAADPSNANSKAVEEKVRAEGSSEKSSSAGPPSLIVHFGLSSLCLIVVNDFNGQNVPLLRLQLNDSRFFSEGRASQITGEGSLNSRVDFYNPSLSLWEPVLERWKPSVKLSTLNNSTVVEIRSDHTMQLTVSGILLETLLKSYSVFFHEYDEQIERQAIADIVVHNCLGDGVDVQLMESGSDTLVMALEGGKSSVVTGIQDKGRGSWRKTMHLPTAVDLQFTGQMKNERMPLFHLPFNINRPKVFNLQPVASSSSESTAAASSKVIVMEPIIEEVYENSRYDPMAGRWRQPYLMGDPFEWTDASGTVRKDIQNIALTSDRWEWQGKWEVDLHGSIGTEIDEDGWEYASSFSFFSIVSPRRAMKQMDCVRRRRWTRTRVPAINKNQDKGTLVRPMTLFWDVQVLKNGSRRVYIRSSFQIVNRLSFPIMVALKHNSWAEEVTLGPIAVEETFCVPLCYAYAVWIRLKPALAAGFEWSYYFPCNLQSYDFQAVKDVSCCSSTNSADATCFRVVTSQTNKSLLISLVPYIVITNKLLCDMRFACTSSDNKVEEGEVLSGTSTKLCLINVSTTPKLAVQVGNFSFSAPLSINTVKDDVVNFQLMLQSEGNERPRKLILTMKSRISATHQGIEIDILSKGAFIDRSGLNALVCSKATPGVLVMRSTFSTPSQMTESSKSPVAPNSAANGSTAALKQLSSISKEGSDDSFVSASSGSELQLAGSTSVASRVSSKQPGEIYSGALKSIIVSGSGRASSDELQVTGGSLPVGLEGHVESQLSLASSSTLTAAAAAASEFVKVNIEPEFYRLVGQLCVNSVRFYELRRANIGDFVYTDNKIVWCHLPHGLWNQMYISTAFADRTHRSNRLIQFKVFQPSFVYVCVDINSSLKWIQTDGFQRISDIAVARRIHKGVLEEFHYAIYGKQYTSAQSEVVLRSSWNKSVTSMYTAFIVPCGVDRVLPIDENGQVCGSQADVELLHAQISYGSAGLDRRVANQSWSEGCNNLSLFYSCDNIITVAVNKGAVWSDEINVDTSKNAASKGSFEVESEQSNITYQLSYTLQSMPGFFSETQLVTLFPRYVILNCVDEVLFVSQQGSEKFCEYQPFKPEGWHKLSQDFGTEVQFRTSSTQWSLGFVDINEIGASVLYIPSRMNTEATFSSGTVLHIEVKVASASDLCSIIVIIWKETIESAKTAMSIVNDTDLPVTVRQAGIEDAHDVGDKLFLFEVCVPGNDSTPFGWADPELGSNVLIAVGDSLKGRVATINLLKSDQLMRLPYNFTKAGGPKGEVVVSVVTKNGGHILQISKLDNAHFSTYEEGMLELEMDGRNNNKDNNSGSAKGAGPSAVSGSVFGLNFILSSFGVSLVVEKPHRRELLSLYVDGLEIYLKSRGNMQSFELLIQDLQVDNYSETVICPVLLRSKRKDRGAGSSKNSTGKDDDDAEASALSAVDGSGKGSGKKDEDVAPFVKITVIKELLPNDATPVFKYVAVRILSLGLEVDSATMQILFTDLLDDLKVLTQSQALALSLPHKWVLNYNRTELFPDQQYSLVNVYQCKINAQRSKMYFKNLIVHPMKLTITFVQTVFPRQQHGETLQSTVLNVFMALVGVEKLQLKMKSFEVEDAMESSSSLMDLVYQSILKDLRSQLTNIAGSLAAIGSPIGFARKVGSGVKAFFYEPYLGAVHSSSDFVSGVKKGTSILISGVVTGAMDSAVAIVGTASKGISYLSGDAEYVRKRAMIRQQNRANQGGIYEGIKDGSESVMSGFASGMSGLVSKPLEEASKGGLKGFIKGIGLGLMGAAVKPVMGLTDGLTSVAHGISNQVESRKFTYVRPARALEPSTLDESSLVIVPLDLDAAVAQEFVMKRAKQGKYEDSFLSYVPLDTKGEAVILSEVYVYWRRTRSLWGRVWANISHVVFIGDGVGIMLYSGGPGGSAELVVVPCGSAMTARRVYAVFAANGHRMGYPSKVIPVDTLFVNQTPNATPTHKSKQQQKQEAEPSALLNQHKVELSQLGALDGYRFGSANHRQLQQITGNEGDVLKRAQYYIEKGVRNWKELDEYIWSLLWEWNCVHSSFGACRCCVTVFINRSDSPIQITRVQMVVGRNVIIMGSPATGFETESRSINPGGFVVIFICAFTQSPLEVGHLRANINTAAFSATVASTQRETSCDAKGGFTVGFLEKSVSEWWCKYVVVMS